MFHNNDYTFSNHLDHMKSIMEDAKKIDITPSNDEDKNVASTLIIFSDKLLSLGLEFNKKMITIDHKIKLGREMSGLAKEMFGDSELPVINGPRSAYLADKILKAQFESFLKVKFSSFEISMSEKLMEKTKIDSIALQITHTKALYDELNTRLHEYKSANTKSFSI